MMRESTPPPRRLRLALSVVFGVVVASLLARLSDAWWWQALPWVLLAGFWILLLRRFRGGADGGGAPAPGGQAS